MEQFLCFTLRQDVPDFNNIKKVKEGSPSFICALKDRLWPKITPRILTVALETKEMPSQVSIQLDSFSLKCSGAKATT